MSIYVYEKKQNRISEIINPVLHYFLFRRRKAERNEVKNG